eukprot:COSAG06_NODE_872_length_11850_cov_8.563952_18_plen_110_part_01
MVTRTEHRQPVYIPISDEQPDRRDESDESGSDDEDSDADGGGATEHMVQIKDNDANFSKFEIQSTRAEGLRPAAFSPDPQRYPRPSRSSKKTRSPTLPIPNEGGLDYYTN